jgi:hypothetical protein
VSPAAAKAVKLAAATRIQAALRKKAAAKAAATAAATAAVAAAAKAKAEEEAEAIALEEKAAAQAKAAAKAEEEARAAAASQGAIKPISLKPLGVPPPQDSAAQAQPQEEGSTPPTMTPRDWALKDIAVGAELRRKDRLAAAAKASTPAPPEPAAPSYPLPRRDVHQGFGSDAEAGAARVVAIEARQKNYTEKGVAAAVKAARAAVKSGKKRDEAVRNGLVAGASSSGGGLEEKFQELCEAYVEQTNNFIKILKNKGYLPTNTKYVDIPESNESLDEMLNNLIVDIETNPVKEDLEGLPSVKEIMDELSGVVVKNSRGLSGKPLSDSSKVALNGNNKIQNLPGILRSLKKDNHRLLEFQQTLKRRKKAGPPRKNYKNTLDALLDRF